MESVGEVPPPADGEDVSARQWLTAQGASDRMLAIADACHATDFGCSIDDLGLKEMVAENRGWQSGEHVLVTHPTPRSHAELGSR